MAWRAVVRVLRSPLDSVTSGVIPGACRICKSPLPRLPRVPVCVSCWSDLPSQSTALCSRCKADLAVTDFGKTPVEGVLCHQCRLAPPPFEMAMAHGTYQGTMRSLLHLLKYEGLEPIARRLGALLAERLVSISALPSNMIVIPVPLSKARQPERGFNQAELLASGVIQAMRRLRPEWEGEFAPGVLARQRATPSQAGLSMTERRRNLRAFFSSKPGRVRGRQMLLVDDIYPTGATARACSQALRRAGTSGVWVVTAARAQRRQIEAFHPRAAADVPMHEDVAIWDGGTPQ